MSDTKRKRPASTPEPTDDMRAWLRGEGTIICELPDGSRRQLTAAECFAGPQRTDRKPVMQEGHLSRSEVPSLPGTISTLAPRIADEQG